MKKILSIKDKNDETTTSAILIFNGETNRYEVLIGDTVYEVCISGITSNLYLLNNLYVASQGNFNTVSAIGNISANSISTNSSTFGSSNITALTAGSIVSSSSTLGAITGTNCNLSGSFFATNVSSNYMTTGGITTAGSSSFGGINSFNTVKGNTIQTTDGTLIIRSNSLESSAGTISFQNSIFDACDVHASNRVMYSVIFGYNLWDVDWNSRTSSILQWGQNSIEGADGLWLKRPQTSSDVKELHWEMAVEDFQGLYLTWRESSSGTPTLIASFPYPPSEITRFPNISLSLQRHCCRLLYSKNDKDDVEELERIELQELLLKKERKKYLLKKYEKDIPFYLSEKMLKKPAHFPRRNKNYKKEEELLEIMAKEKPKRDIYFEGFRNISKS